MQKYLILILLLLLLSSCVIDFTKKDTKEKKLYGKVCKKYRDDWNHGEPTIVYINKNGEFIYQMSDWAIYSDLWSYLQVGDSIIKPSGTLTLRVKHADGTFKDYKYQR